jgi:hypothetical protein
MTRHCQLVGHVHSVAKLQHEYPTPANHYKNHRFPVAIISHAVWLYFRFCLSFRDVEELLLRASVTICGGPWIKAGTRSISW